MLKGSDNDVHLTGKENKSDKGYTSSAEKAAVMCYFLSEEWCSYVRDTDWSMLMSLSKL